MAQKRSLWDEVDSLLTEPSPSSSSSSIWSEVDDLLNVPEPAPIATRSTLSTSPGPGSGQVQLPSGLPPGADQDILNTLGLVPRRNDAAFAPPRTVTPPEVQLPPAPAMPVQTGGGRGTGLDLRQSARGMQKLADVASGVLQAPIGLLQSGPAAAGETAFSQPLPGHQNEPDTMFGRLIAHLKMTATGQGGSVVPASAVMANPPDTGAPAPGDISMQQLGQMQSGYKQPGLPPDSADVKIQEVARRGGATALKMLQDPAFAAMGLAPSSVAEAAAAVNSGLAITTAIQIAQRPDATDVDVAEGVVNALIASAPFGAQALRKASEAASKVASDYRIVRDAQARDNAAFDRANNQGFENAKPVDGVRTDRGLPPVQEALPPAPEKPQPPVAPKPADVPLDTLLEDVRTADPSTTEGYHQLQTALAELQKHGIDANAAAKLAGGATATPDAGVAPVAPTDSIWNEVDSVLADPEAVRPERRVSTGGENLGRRTGDLAREVADRNPDNPALADLAARTNGEATLNPITNETIPKVDPAFAHLSNSDLLLELDQTGGEARGGAIITELQQRGLTAREIRGDDPLPENRPATPVGSGATPAAKPQPPVEPKAPLIELKETTPYRDLSDDDLHEIIAVSPEVDAAQARAELARRQPPAKPQPPIELKDTTPYRDLSDDDLHEIIAVSPEVDAAQARAELARRQPPAVEAAPAKPQPPVTAKVKAPKPVSSKSRWAELDPKQQKGMRQGIGPVEGANSRWGELVRRGATDEEILAQAREEFGLGGGRGTPGGVDTGHVGGKNPVFVVGNTSHHAKEDKAKGVVKLTGLALAHTLRDALGIPQPVPTQGGGRVPAAPTRTSDLVQGLGPDTLQPGSYQGGPDYSWSGATVATFPEELAKQYQADAAAGRVGPLRQLLDKLEALATQPEEYGHEVFVQPYLDSIPALQRIVQEAEGQQALPVVADEPPPKPQPPVAPLAETVTVGARTFTRPSLQGVKAAFPKVESPPSDYYEIDNSKGTSAFPPGFPADWYQPFIDHFREREQTAHAQASRYLKKGNQEDGARFTRFGMAWGAAADKAELRQKRAGLDTAGPHAPATPASKPAPPVAPKASDRERELQAEVEALQKKTGGRLTKAQATRFREVMRELHLLQYERRQEPTKLKTQSQRQSRLPDSVVKVAWQDLHRDKGIYLAVGDAASGVAFDADTAIDAIMNGQNADISPEAFYRAFDATREALRENFGHAIRLYRATGKQKDKATTNWATTAEYARQFGAEVIDKQVPVDDILAVNVGPGGNYHEVIVGKAPVAAQPKVEAPAPDKGRIIPTRTGVKTEAVEDTPRTGVSASEAEGMRKNLAYLDRELATERETGPRNGETPDRKRQRVKDYEGRRDAVLAILTENNALPEGYAQAKPAPPVAPKKAPIEKLPLPKGWTAVVGRTSTKEGHTAEAEVDWQHNRLVFAEQQHLDNPTIWNHEIAHVLFETLPDAERAAFERDYIEAKKDAPDWQEYGVEWVVKNKFHRESIAMDMEAWLADREGVTPALQAVFAQHLQPLLTPAKPAPPVEPKAEAPRYDSPQRQAVASGVTFKAGERVEVTEGTGTVFRFDPTEGNVKISLAPDGRLSNWIPATRVTRLADEAPAPVVADPTPEEVDAALDAEDTSDAAVTLGTRTLTLLSGLLARMEDVGGKAPFPKHAGEFRAWLAKTMGVKDALLADHIDAVNDGVEAAFADYLRAAASHATPAEGFREAVMLEGLLPRAQRSIEKMQLQQFSTPLPIAYLAGRAARLRDDDLVLEPTAGTGNLLVGVPLGLKAPGVQVAELGRVRAALLRAVGYKVLEADYLAARLEQKPSVIIANPPWGKFSTGKYGKAVGLEFTPVDVAERFVAKMMRDLQPNGRLVAIMPTTMVESREFKKWLQNTHTVQAIIQAPPGSYDTRATTVDSILLVVDKGHGDGSPLPALRLTADWRSFENLIDTIPARLEAAPHDTTQRPVVRPAPTAGEPRAGGRAGQLPDRGRPDAGGDAGVRPGQPADVVAARPAPEQPRAESVAPGNTPESAAEEPAGEFADIPDHTKDERRKAGGSGLFAPYTRRTQLRGVGHPKLIVEARSLAGVEYPALTLKPGKAVLAALQHQRVSVEQAEQALAAVQANLEGHHGYLAADNVGVGKSREIALTILELMERAKAGGYPQRLVITTKNADNIKDLIDNELFYVATGRTREGADLMNPGAEKAQPGALPFEVVAVSDWPDGKKTGQDYKPLPVYDHAIYVTDFYNLASFRQALVDVGPTGVVGDEAHRFKNVEGAAAGGAWQALHATIMRDVERKRQAFAYFTATPAQSVYDYQYLYGLRMWPIDGFQDWIDVVTGNASEADAAKLEKAVEDGAKNIDRVADNKSPTVVGGDAEDTAKTDKPSKFGARPGSDVFQSKLTPAEAEQIPREWKILGRFSARDLWRDGQEFAVHEAVLPEVHAKKYDQFTELAQDIAAKAYKFGLLDKTGKSSRFGVTGQLQFAAKRVQMQPALEEAIRLAKAKVAEGYQVVLSVVNVTDMDPEKGNIAAAIEKINTRIQDVDPDDPDGGVIDQGEIPEALIAREELMERARELGMFDSPVTMMEEAFGAENVAFITGQEGAGPRRKAMTEFQAGTRKVALLSAAGSTGINLDHRVWVDPAEGEAVEVKVGNAWVKGKVSVAPFMAGKKGGTGETRQRKRVGISLASDPGTVKNYDLDPADVRWVGGRRLFIDVQYEWSATESIQRYGRVGRSASLTQPVIMPLTFGNASEKKFLATIANRMAALGALSKGGADSTGASALEEFEIAGPEAVAASRSAYNDLDRDEKRQFAVMKSSFRSPNRGANDPFEPAPRASMNTQMRDFQLALLFVPLQTSNKFWQSFLTHRAALREALGHAGENRTAAYSGEVIRSTELPDHITLSEVKNQKGQRFGILSGLITPKMPRIKELVRPEGYGLSRRYVTFQAGDQTISGLQIGWGKLPALAKVLGGDLAAERLDTPEKVLAALKADVVVPLQQKGAGGDHWQLRLRQDGRIVIIGTRMADRTLLLNNHGAFSPVGAYFFVTEANLPAFLDRFPVQHEEGTKPPPPVDPKPSRGTGGGPMLQATVLPGAAEFVEQDILPGLKAAAAAVVQNQTDIRSLFAPDTVSGDSVTFAGVMRANIAAHHQRNQRAQRVLAEFEREMGKRSDEENLQFIDAVEGGRLESLPPDLRGVADLLRGVLDRKRGEVQRRGRLTQYIENYFPHEWAKPSAVKKLIGQLMGRRPLAGKKSFLKKRSIPTVMEGVALGLNPASYNPVTLVLMKLIEMDKWMMAHDILREAKGQAIAKFVRVGTEAPAGWVPFDQTFGTVWGPPRVVVKEAYDKQLMEALESFVAALGVQHERGGMARWGKRWGLAFGDERIVTRPNGPETVLMHELGHILDHRYGIGREMVNHPRYKQELRDLADKRHDGLIGVPQSQRRYVREAEEKIANLVHAFIWNPEGTKKVAPHSYWKLYNLAKGQPELKRLIRLQKVRSLVLTTRDNEVSTGGPILRGRYYGPPEVTRLLDNHLSPGLSGRSVAFDGYRRLGNIINQVQLGLSLFHFTMVSIESIISKQAQALQEFSRGEVKRGLISQVEVPLAPILDFFKGHKALKHFYDKDANAKVLDSVIGTVVQAGGGFGWDTFFHESGPKKFMEALRKGNYPGAAMRALPALIELQAKPIMEGYVPRLKMGAFLSLAQMELRTLGEQPELHEVRRVLARVWDSVDNRFGELRYDNLFWNRTLQQLGMASVRALGWNIGTLREIAGAPGELLKTLGLTATPGGGGGGGKPPTRRVHTGFEPDPMRPDSDGLPIYEDKPERGLGLKLSYVLSMFWIAGLVGAIYQYLHTGKHPESLKDLYFPRTGNTLEDGTEERVSIPGYFKDVYGVLHDLPGSAMTTLGHKLHPLLAILYDMSVNEDFFGTEIRNPDDPYVQQVEQIMSYMAEEVRPFTVQSFQKAAAEHSTSRMVESMFGIQRAPASVTRTAAESKLVEIQRRKGAFHSTQAQAEARQKRAAVRSDLKAGDRKAAVEDALGLSPRQVQQAVRESRMTRLQRGLRSLSLAEALEVYQVATPEERGDLQPALVAKAKNATVGGEEAEALGAKFRKAMTLPREKKTPAATGKPAVESVFK